MEVITMKKLLTVWLVTGCLVITTSAHGAWWNWWQTYTKTKHPIVLAHGLMGFDSMLGLIDYWPGIVERLEDGGATVFVAQVSTVNSSIERGEQLLDQIEEFLAISGAEKVNLIGHSQGSLDARYVATVRPDLIASITSVGGPHSAIPDLTADEYLSLIEVLGNLISALSGNSNPNDVEKLAAMFTGIDQFNADYPIGLPDVECGEGDEVVNVNGHDIYVYSWGGTGLVTTGIDVTDALFLISSDLVEGPNDGLVGQCSNHLGRVIRDDYFQNHLDIVNMMFGLVSIFDANPKTIFRVHANRLKNAGL